MDGPPCRVSWEREFKQKKGLTEVQDVKVGSLMMLDVYQLMYPSHSKPRKNAGCFGAWGGRQVFFCCLCYPLGRNSEIAMGMQYEQRLSKMLVGGFKHLFIFTPKLGEDEHILTGA